MFRSAKPRFPRRAATALALTLSICTLVATITVVAARQSDVTLPPDVTTWLARNQVRRWAAMIQTGEKIFKEGSCSRCHGEGGRGGRAAPDLTDKAFVQGDGSLANIGEVIMWGVRRKDLSDQSRPFQMNPSGGMHLDAEQLDALTAYVWSLSHGTFLPSR